MSLWCTRCFSSSYNTYSSLEGSKLVDEPTKSVQKRKSACSCLPKCCRRGCAVLLCLAIFLLLGAALFLRYVKGDEAARHIAGAPHSTEQCVDDSPFCWLETSIRGCGEAETACKRSCDTCTPYDEGMFIPKLIPMDEVEQHMTYAKNGSSIPESLHGIWWMDQSGSGRPLDGDPDYPFDFNMTAEVLISFGDEETTWQEETGCVTPVPFYAGTKGHFLLLNNKFGMKQWESFVESRFTIHFCFTNSSQQEILLWSTVKDTSGAIPDFKRRLLGYTDFGNDYLLAPQWLAHMTMVKKPWGWDRVTNVLTDNTRALLTEDNVDAVSGLLSEEMEEVLREQVKSHAETINRDYRYPVLQIVDGNGQKTDNYDKYLNFMRRIYKHTPAVPPDTAILAMRV